MSIGSKWSRSWSHKLQGISMIGDDPEESLLSTYRPCILCLTLKATFPTDPFSTCEHQLVTCSAWSTGLLPRSKVTMTHDGPTNQHSEPPKWHSWELLSRICGSSLSYLSDHHWLVLWLLTEVKVLEINPFQTSNRNAVLGDKYLLAYLFLSQHPHYRLSWTGEC